MKKKCKVVMLPTEKAMIKHYSEIVILKGNGLGNLAIPATGEHILENLFLGYSPQHLYLISKDDIEEDDWFIMNYCILRQCKSFKGAVLEDTTGGIQSSSNCRKVIASTDQLQIGIGMGSLIYIPTFSEDFIKSYVKADDIDEVMVDFNYFQDLDTKEEVWALNLRDDRTVIITEAKTSYTQKEVEALLQEFGNYILDNVRLRDYGAKLSDGKSADWLENKL